MFRVTVFSKSIVSAVNWIIRNSNSVIKSKNNLTPCKEASRGKIL